LYLKIIQEYIYIYIYISSISFKITENYIKASETFIALHIKRLNNNIYIYFFLLFFSDLHTHAIHFHSPLSINSMSFSSAVYVFSSRERGHDSPLTRGPKITGGSFSFAQSRSRPKCAMYSPCSRQERCARRLTSRVAIANRAWSPPERRGLPRPSPSSSPSAPCRG